MLWFFAQREGPIHVREFPGSTALPQRFCNNCQASVLFRLGAINFLLRHHGRDSRVRLAEINVQVQATVPASAMLIQRRRQLLVALDFLPRFRRSRNSASIKLRDDVEKALSLRANVLQDQAFEAGRCTWV